MGTRPDFTKTNVLSDKAMTDAFKQGYTEGQAHRDAQIIWDVTVFFEGTKLNVRRFESKDEMTKFVLDNLDTPGQAVTIQTLWVTASAGEGTDSAPALEAGDDEIVDAEVVEED